jgi:acetyl esterase
LSLDPTFRAILDQLAEAGATPLVRGSAAATREHYRSLAMARRSGDYRPEPVGEVTDAEAPGPAGPIPLRVYQPVSERGRLVTFLHGGGWVVGDLDTHDPVCRRVANALGATVVAVDYRLAPEHPHPAPLDDTCAGLAWSAVRFPGRAHVVGGDSAGASLAAGAALRARDAGGPPLAAQLLIYPATAPGMDTTSARDNAEGYFLTGHDMSWFYDQYLPDPDARADPSVAVLRAPDLAGLPPSVVATAEFDPLRDEGDAYAEALRAAGVTVRHLPGPGLIHGYFAFIGLAEAAERRGAEVLAALDDLLP